MGLLFRRICRSIGCAECISSSDFIRPKSTQKVYRDNRLGAQTPIHRSSNNCQPSSHWLLFNVTIHNPYPTWFPHKRRKAVLALLLTCGFTRNYQVTQLVPLLRNHSVPPTHDLPLKVSHVSQVFLQQLAKPHVT